MIPSWKSPIKLPVELPVANVSLGLPPRCGPSLDHRCRGPALDPLQMLDPLQTLDPVAKRLATIYGNIDYIFLDFWGIFN